jgi:hypothetical protein
MIDPSGEMGLGGITISVSIGGGLIGSISGASISYMSGVRGWRNIGASAFSGLVSGSILGAAYGFSIGTGRFPIVFVEGLATAISNAFSSILAQIATMIPRNNPFDMNIVTSAFIDGLVWGTAASAFGGEVYRKLINGRWQNILEEDIYNQVKYAMIVSIGRDISNFVANSIRGTENRSWSDILVGTTINAVRAGLFVAVLNRVMSESNIHDDEIAWIQILIGTLTNIGIGTWIDIARDYVIENF